MQEVFEEYGFEMSDNGRGEQTFESAQEVAETLVNLKLDLFENGFEVESESIQGTQLVCKFSSENDSPVSVIQDVNSMKLTVSTEQ